MKVEVKFSVPVTSTQELEKKGLCVGVKSDTTYNYFEISWAKKK